MPPPSVPTASPPRRPSQAKVVLPPTPSAVNGSRPQTPLDQSYASLNQSQGAGLNASVGSNLELARQRLRGNSVYANSSASNSRPASPTTTTPFAVQQPDAIKPRALAPTATAPPNERHADPLSSTLPPNASRPTTHSNPSSSPSVTFLNCTVTRSTGKSSWGVSIVGGANALVAMGTKTNSPASECPELANPKYPLLFRTINDEEVVTSNDVRNVLKDKETMSIAIRFQESTTFLFGSESREPHGITLVDGQEPATVASVSAGSPAERAGVVAGTIIAYVNSTLIQSSDDAMRLLNTELTSKIIGFPPEDWKMPENAPLQTSSTGNTPQEETSGAQPEATPQTVETAPLAASTSPPPAAHSADTAAVAPKQDEPTNGAAPTSQSNSASREGSPTIRKKKKKVTSKANSGVGSTTASPHLLSTSGVLNESQRASSPPQRKFVSRGVSAELPLSTSHDRWWTSRTLAEDHGRLHGISQQEREREEEAVANAEEIEEERRKRLQENGANDEDDETAAAARQLAVYGELFHRRALLSPQKLANDRNGSPALGRGRSTSLGHQSARSKSNQQMVDEFEHEDFYDEPHLAPIAPAMPGHQTNQGERTSAVHSPHVLQQVEGLVSSRSNSQQPQHQAQQRTAAEGLRQQNETPSRSASQQVPHHSPPMMRRYYGGAAPSIARDDHSLTGVHGSSSSGRSHAAPTDATSHSTYALHGPSQSLPRAGGVSDAGIPSTSVISVANVPIVAVGPNIKRVEFSVSVPRAAASMSSRSPSMNHSGLPSASPQHHQHHGGGASPYGGGM